MTAATLPTRPLRHDATLIGLVGLAHGVSHFSQLLLAPLFPWLREEFQVGYAQLGFLLTIFFVVSCAVRALSGFLVDRHGPRPVLFAGLGLLGLAALGFAASRSYTMLALCSVVAGVGNGVFHPVDYTLLNRKVGKARLGHAYSVHGITGSLGWALAPALLVPITLAASWRVALLCAAGLVFAVLAVLVWQRDQLQVAPLPPAPAAAGRPAAAGTFDFLKLPAVWVCFGFFFLFAGALSIVQSFAPEAARQLHDVPLRWVGLCLTVYMVCAAAGMVLGGFLLADPRRSERIVAIGLGLAAAVALLLALGDVAGWAVPLLFGAMGFFSGTASPSRDMLVKAAAPDNATGRVYGVVYGGLDIGQAVVPLVVGTLMDQGAYRGVWLALVLLQGTLILTAFNVRRARRTALQPA
ncbi:MAG: MFS transporter [Burkholderiales bacterium]|nr:MFS transporter [Burkholderiales bacterium]